MRRRTFHRTITGASALALAVAGTVALASPVAALPLTASTEGELIVAITTANIDPATDTITLGANITLTANLPAITESVDIVGAGFSIDGGVGRFSVFTDTGATSAIAISLTGVTVTGTDSAVTTNASDLTLSQSDFDDAPVTVTGSSVTVEVSDSTFAHSTGVGFSADLNDSSQLRIEASTAEENTDQGFEISLFDHSSLTMIDSTAKGTIDGSGIDLGAYGASTATITGSHANDNGNEGFDASAYGGSTVSISNSTASRNVDDGFDVDEADSQVILDECTSTGNESAGFDILVQKGTVTGTHLTARGNGEQGLSAVAGPGSTITISDSAFLDTADGFGADLIVDDASVSLHRIRTSGSVTYDGGGVRIADWAGEPSTVDILDSTLSDNLGSGLDISASSTTTTVERTTISGNDQEGGGGIFAGLEGTASLTVSNSTVSGNRCGGGCGVLAVTYQSDDTSVTIANSTIFGNKGVYGGESAGIEIAGTPYTIRNSVVAGNSINGTSIDFLIADGTPAVGSVDYSLVQTSVDAALTAVTAGTGNLKDIAAKLGPLADNGGPTLTHLLLAGSPAINAGEPAFSGLSTDQRGLTRVVGVLDIGAVEVQPALAATGADAPVPLTGGILLLGVGALLLLVQRRRRVPLDGQRAIVR